MFGKRSNYINNLLTKQTQYEEDSTHYFHVCVRFGD